MNLIHNKLKTFSNYAICAIITALITFFITKSMSPDKVSNIVEIEKNQKEEILKLNNVIKDLKSEIEKYEESKKFSLKERKYYKDGTLKSEKDLTQESSLKFEKQLTELKEFVETHEMTIRRLQEQIYEKTQVKNNLFRFNALAAYDSEKKEIEPEVNMSYSFFASSASANLNDGSWRVGVGLGTNF